MTATPTILVAGIGNIFLGDDGFGPAVIRRLAQRAAPANVRIGDFGIRGIDLAYALLEPWELVIVIDLVQRDAAPGSVHVIEVDEDANALSSRTPDAHGMVPARALDLARALAGKLPPIVLVGCQPARFDASDDGELGLSPPVAAAVDVAIATIDSLLERHRTTVTPCMNSA